MHTRHMPLAVLLMLVIAACERGAPCGSPQLRQ
jgi:hypothetical protein